jgi:hypothetical protein
MVSRVSRSTLEASAWLTVEFPSCGLRKQPSNLGKILPKLSPQRLSKTRTRTKYWNFRRQLYNSNKNKKLVWMAHVLMMSMPNAHWDIKIENKVDPFHNRCGRIFFGRKFRGRIRAVAAHSQGQEEGYRRARGDERGSFPGRGGDGKGERGGIVMSLPVHREQIPYTFLILESCSLTSA